MRLFFPHSPLRGPLRRACLCCPRGSRWDTCRRPPDSELHACRSHRDKDLGEETDAQTHVVLSHDDSCVSECLSVRRSLTTRSVIGDDHFLSSSTRIHPEVTFGLIGETVSPAHRTATRAVVPVHTVGGTYAGSFAVHTLADCVHLAGHVGTATFA